jgi:hypothetical protein
MRKYKVIAEGVIITIIGAFILFCSSFISDVNTEQQLQNKDIFTNTNNIDYLQKTQNATHNTVVEIQYEIKDLVKKDDFNDLKAEIKALILWLNSKHENRLTEEKRNYHYSDSLTSINH